MSVHNKKSVVLFPLILALILISGIFIGLKLNRSGISDRLLILPRGDKVNNVLNLIEDSYVDSVSRDNLEETAIEAILQKLDPHSVYIPADEFQAVNEPLEGNFSGIGIQFNAQNDTIIVVNTVPNGPSERIGLRAGDRLVRINDTIVAGVKMPTGDIVKRLKGPKGSKVKVTIKRLGVKDSIDFRVSRDVIPLYSVDAAYMLAPQVGYIKINKFAKTTHEEFLTAAKKLHKEGMKKIIVDLRGNSGGLLESAIRIADEFLDDHQLIVYTKGRARARTESYSKPGGECLKDSVIILIDESSASASEILAGAIQDNDRGWIVGRRSFGKCLVQEQSMLPGGAAIRLTIARYYTPSGRCIQKPYNNGKTNYFNELHNRILHGEMEQADSIKFNDSLRYKTVGGRIVYGGGGIMPDYFVPADTSLFSNYYYMLHEKGILYRFAFHYSDANRKILAKFKTYQALIKFLKKENVFEKMLDYADKQGIKKNYSDIKISSELLQTQLEAYIVRNFFDNNGFYPVYNTIDSTIKEAVIIFEGKGKQHKS
ncbi:MAG TPA: S41 family peptidase [Bacteroidales bacterium]